MWKNRKVTYKPGEFYGEPIPPKEDEIEGLVKRIREKKYSDYSDLAGCLGGLGLGNAVQYRKLIEGFLEYQQDSFTAATALGVLFEDFNLREEYLDVVKEAIKGTEWDDSSWFQSKGIACARQYLKDTFDGELLQLLLERFQDINEEPFIRAVALEAIAVAMGRNYSATPPLGATMLSLEENRMDLIDPTIMEWAYKNLAKQQ